MLYTNFEQYTEKNVIFFFLWRVSSEKQKPIHSSGESGLCYAGPFLTHTTTNNVRNPDTKKRWHFHEALRYIFYKEYFNDVSREFDGFQVNRLLIFASCVVGTCNILYWWVFIRRGFYFLFSIAVSVFFFFFFYPPADGEKYSFSSPHFHVFSYASCVDLTPLLSQPNASWRTLRVPL